VLDFQHMPLLLDRATVASTFTMADAIPAAREAFLALEAGSAHMPERLAVRVEEHGGTHLTMPCYVEQPGGGIVNVKIATVYPENPSRFQLGTTLAFLVLQDARSGELLALMDAEHLTRMRTGAGCAVATDLLAREDSRVMTVFGAGAQAEAQVEAMVAVRPIERVWVVSRSPERRETFISEIRRTLNVQCLAGDDPRRCVSESDIVCTATSSKTPVVEGAWLPAGTHVNSVGSFKPDLAELDPTAIAKCKVFVDHEPAARNGAGELIKAVAAGTWDWNLLGGSLGQLLMGKTPGRSSPEDITLFKSVGIAVQDSFAAATIYRRAVERGLGTPFSLG
jgi:ornithine cyclodeaminase/alanine dehydrogenase-like protein (mu-crystallin family)